MDNRGNTIILQQWDATLYSSKTVMVAFDQNYVEGTLQALPWKLIRFGVDSTLKKRDILLAKNDILGAPQDYCIVRIQYHRQNKKSKSWTPDGQAIFLAPRCSKIVNFSSALKPGRNVQIRYSLGGYGDATETMSSSSNKTFRDFEIDNIVDLDFLVD